jgi:hypothetical protein
MTSPAGHMTPPGDEEEVSEFDEDVDLPSGRQAPTPATQETRAMATNGQDVSSEFSSSPDDEDVPPPLPVSAVPDIRSKSPGCVNWRELI